MPPKELTTLAKQIYDAKFYFIELRPEHTYAWAEKMMDLLDRLYKPLGARAAVRIDNLGVTVTVHEFPEGM